MTGSCTRNRSRIQRIVDLNPNAIFLFGKFYTNTFLESFQ